MRLYNPLQTPPKCLSLEKQTMRSQMLPLSFHMWWDWEGLPGILVSYSIREAFRSNTENPTLMKVKDPLPTKQIASVVYEVPSIVLVYIGETKHGN